MSTLYNKYDKDTLKRRLEKKSNPRTTISFYRYTILDNVEALRDKLYEDFRKMDILGRIYIAKEGINAQISIPTVSVPLLRNYLDRNANFNRIPFKIAIEDDGKSFLKLMIKVKKQIVADGLTPEDYDITNVGNHLSAKEFNAAMNEEGTIVVDMRNHYESEIGHFKDAILPQVETFKEELPIVAEDLKGEEDTKILLYCTGGIRCEKASAYLKHKGFKDVNQLHGGIIDYARQIKEESLENKFIGKNFVFDERLAESISEDIISNCHQCGKPCDTHTNCKNVGCNLLFIQCDDCAKEYEGCCTPNCKDINSLPLAEQKKLRKGKEVRKRFNKGLSYPNELIDKINKQKGK